DPRNPARSRTPADRPASQPRARSSPRAARRESTPQTDRSVRSPDPSRPEAKHPHPSSPTRHQTPLPQPGLQRFQNQSVLRYTLSASGLLPSIAKVAAAQRLSLIRSPDAPNWCEKCRLADMRGTCGSALHCGRQRGLRWLAYDPLPLVLRERGQEGEEAPSAKNTAATLGAKHGNSVGGGTKPINSV